MWGLILIPITLFSEDFSSASRATPPPGWTQVLLEGNPEIDQWRFDNPGNRSFIGADPLVDPVAVYDSDALSDDGIEESVALISPVFDAFAAESVFLLYDQYYNVGVGEDNIPDPLSFEFALGSRPSSAVTLNFVVDDAQLQPIDSLTFNPENWFEPQTSTVCAIADGI